MRGAIRSTAQSRRSLDLLSRIEASCFSTMKTELTAEYVREALSYDPDTGILTWKKRPLHHFEHRAAQRTWNTRYSGTEAGSERGTKRLNQERYLGVRVCGVTYMAHRIIWLLLKGSFPASQIDHINNRRQDNRLVNLREATPSQNQHNSPLQRNNTTGVKGVYFDKRTEEWVGRVYLKRKIVWSARRKNLEGLVIDLIAARERTHQEFKNHG